MTHVTSLDKGDRVLLEFDSLFNSKDEPTTREATVHRAGASHLVLSYAGDKWRVTTDGRVLRMTRDGKGLDNPRRHGVDADVHALTPVEFTFTGSGGE